MAAVFCKRGKCGRRRCVPMPFPGVMAPGNSIAALRHFINLCPYIRPSPTPSWGAFPGKERIGVKGIPSMNDMEGRGQAAALRGLWENNPVPSPFFTRMSAWFSSTNR